MPELTTADLLVQTKLSPPVRGGLIPRPELLERLQEARRLVLARAPAGWGKTTLLAEFAAATGERTCAWLALDHRDNEPHRFWSYVIEALRAAGRSVGERSIPLLEAPGVDIAERVLPALVNELAGSKQGMALVLDDYHVVHAPAIHAGLGFLVDHLPAGCLVAIASRSEPPLPLSRWRARGDLVEIDAAALRLSEAQAEALLNDVHGLSLADEQVATLRERTEGWAAGLYLAALSLRGRNDRAAFVRRFAADDRFIVDYLGAEVLVEQPEEVRSFLLRTSVLERFCAPLCDAVTGVRGSARLLAEIERSNLFLVPLDSRREWYRYHQLFGELLGLELRRSDPALVPELHRRAAAWYLGAGLPSDGIHHTVLAGDLEEAGDLVARHWPAAMAAGQDIAVAAWLDDLSVDVVRADARLCLAEAFTALSLGRLDRVDPAVRAAEGAPLRGPLHDGTGSVEAAVAAVRAIHGTAVGDLVAAREAATRAHALLPESSQWHSAAASMLAAASWWLGERGDAVALLESSLSRTRALGLHAGTVFNLGHLALVAAEEGRPGRAQELAREALAAAQDHGAVEHWVASSAHLARGLALEARARLDDAQEALARSVELGGRGAGAVQNAYALLALARVHTRLGHPIQAGELLADARAVVAGCPEPGAVGELLEACVRQPVRSQAAARPGEPLTERELAVLRLLASPLSQREIAGELYVSLNTVKSHTRSIFRKLGVGSRQEAVERGRELGLS